MTQKHTPINLSQWAHEVARYINEQINGTTNQEDEIVSILLSESLIARAPELEAEIEETRQTLQRMYEWLCTGEAMESEYHRITKKLVEKNLQRIEALKDRNE